MPSLEQTHFLEESAKLWDTIIDVLDIFGQILGKVKIGRGRLCELFRLAITAAEVGEIPQTLDQVLVGSADRIRPWATRAVFVLGANEGVFPPAVASAGVFSDTERQQLIEGGLGIAPASFSQTVLERFFAYFAVTLPGEQLTVSYAKADLQGKQLLPSVIVSQLQELFPQLEPFAITPEDTLVGDAPALATLVEHYGENSPLTATLLSYFAERQGQVLNRLQQAAKTPLYQIKNPRLSRELFGSRMRFSPSRVERYHRCPFAYFAQDGLSLKKRRRADFSPLESGSLLHHVLQIMVQKYGGKGLTKRTLEQLQQECQEIIKDYLAQRVEDIAAMPARFKYLFTRLTNTLAQLLQQLGKEFLQSEFKPIAFELKIGEREDLPPLAMVSEGGIPVMVEGIIDRVDVMEKNGVRYLRVVDYKSGGKQFNLADVLYGVNMQMLLYLFTLEEFSAKKGEPALPAGVLYMPVVERYLSADRDTNPETLENERERQWAMSGLLLADDVSLQGMEHDLEGLYIPVRKNKNNSYSAYSSLASLEQMGKLNETIQRQIKAMADHLAKGDIPANPIYTTAYPTCDYCDYKGVCGHEAQDPIREIARLDRQSVFELLEKKEKEGDNA